MFVQIYTSVSALDVYSFVIILIVRRGTFHELFAASQLVLRTSFPPHSSFSTPTIPKKEKIEQNQTEYTEFPVIL